MYACGMKDIVKIYDVELFIRFARVLSLKGTMFVRKRLINGPLIFLGIGIIKENIYHVQWNGKKQLQK